MLSYLLHPAKIHKQLVRDLSLEQVIRYKVKKPGIKPYPFAYTRYFSQGALTLRVAIFRQGRVWDIYVDLALVSQSLPIMFSQGRFLWISPCCNNCLSASLFNKYSFHADLVPGVLAQSRTFALRGVIIPCCCCYYPMINSSFASSVRSLSR